MWSVLVSWIFIITGFSNADVVHLARSVRSDHTDNSRTGSRGGGLEVRYWRWPESVWAPIGDDVSFECQLNVPPELLKWRFRPLSDPRRPFIDRHEEGPMLPVKVTNTSVQGDYQCIAWYGSSALASPWGTLRITQEIPSTSVLPRRMVSLTVPKGNPVILRCNASDAKPSPTVLYYRLRPDGTEEMDSTSVISSRRSGSDSSEVGIIPAVSSANSGEYGCSVRATLGSSPTRAKGGFRLQVVDVPHSQAPRFIEETYAKELQMNTSSVLEVLLGSEARLECGAVGWPVPSIDWIKDGQNLGGIITNPNATSRYGRFTMEYGGRLLYISDLRPDDEGVYTCTASNAFGSILHSRTLRVLRPAKLRPGDRSQPAKSPTMEGGSVHMNCGQADGVPRPKYHWLLNGVNATTDSAVVLKGPDLYINRVEKRHAGIVQCFVSNDCGQDSVAFLLTVTPMQINGQPTSEDDAVGALRGASVIDAALETPRKRHRGRKGSRKHKGSAIMVPPSRPNVTRLSDESVMVRWAVPANIGLPIQFFKVQYKELSAGSWMTANQDIPPHQYSYSVDGLTPDRMYRFRVAAVYSNNDNKLGATSGRYHLTRGSSGIRPAAPIGPEAEPYGPNQLRLFWEYPASAKIRPDGFYCYYRPTSSAGEYFKASAEGPAARELLLPYLVPDTPYELKLQAFTASAASDFSNIIVARTAKRDPPKNNTLASATDESQGGGGFSSSSGDSKADQAASDGKGGVWAAAGAAAGTGVLLAALSLLLYRRRRRTCSKAGNMEKDGTIGGGGTAAIPLDCRPIEPRSDAVTPLRDEAEVSENDALERRAGSDESTASLADSDEPSPSPPPRAVAQPAVRTRPPPYSCKDEIRAQMGHHTTHTHHTYV